MKKQLQRKLTEAEFNQFNNYNKMLSDMIEQNLIRVPGDPYTNAMTFLFALENSKAQIISSLEVSGIVKGKNTGQEIAELCNNFEKKRQHLMASNSKFKKEIRSLSPEQLKSRLQKLQKDPRKENTNTMYR